MTTIDPKFKPTTNGMHFLSIITLISILTTPIIMSTYPDTRFRYIHSTKAHQQRISEVLRRNFKTKQTTKTNLRVKDILLRKPPNPFHLSVEYDYSLLHNYKDKMNKEALSYLQTIVFPKLARYIKYAFKVRHPTPITSLRANFGDSVQCYKKAKFSTRFLEHFKGGLGLLITFEGGKEDDFLAWSLPCSLDDISFRPVLGQLNVNPEFISLESFNNIFGTFLHEIFHILGFSPSLFDYFIDSEMSLIDQSSLFEFSKDKEERVIGIKSPRMLQAARKHFGCQRLKYLPLENEGGKGSKGSHWERAYMMNDIMTASFIINSRVSAITLSLFEDSGWYEVDHTFDEFFSYQQGDGCSVFDPWLLEPLAPSETEPENLDFSRDNSCEYHRQIGCFYDYTHQAKCFHDFFEQTQPESPNSTETPSPQSDTKSASLGQDLRYFASEEDSCVNSNLIQKRPQLFGEIYDDTSRCFKGELNRIQPLEEGVLKGIQVKSTGSFCFQAKCAVWDLEDKRTAVVLFFIQGEEYLCEPGMVMKLVRQESLVGKIYCPDISKFCKHSPKCGSNCSEEGRCLANGRCYKFY